MSAFASLLIPGTNTLVFGSKTSDVYVANTSNLGHLIAGDTALLQKFRAGVIQTVTDDNHNRLTAVVYWPLTSGSQLYAWPSQDKLYSYTYNGRTFAPNGVGPFAGPNDPGPASSLLANGSQSGTGILWAPRQSVRRPTPCRNPRHSTPSTLSTSASCYGRA